MNIKDALKTARKFKHKLSEFQKKDDTVYVAYCKEKGCNCKLFIDTSSEGKTVTGSALQYRCGKHPIEDILPGGYRANYKSPMRGNEKV